MKQRQEYFWREDQRQTKTKKTDTTSQPLSKLSEAHDLQGKFFIQGGRTAYKASFPIGGLTTYMTSFLHKVVIT